MEKTNSRQQTSKTNPVNRHRPFFISLIIGGLLITGFYFLYSLNYQNHFLPKTEVYGIDISDKNVEQAATALHQKLDQMNFQITENDRVLFSVSSKELKLKKNYPALLKELMKKQNPAFWGVKALAFSQSDATPVNNQNLTVLIDQKSLNQFENKVKNELNQKRTPPQNARIELQGGKYQLVKQVAGNTVNFERLQKKIETSIFNSNREITITESDYQRPTVRDNDSKLQENFKQLKTIQDTKITYQVANVATIEIPRDTITKWIQFDDKDVNLNESDIYNYLANINAKYSTVGITRQFRTSDGANIKVTGGTYGRQIQIKTDCQKIKDNLLAGKSGIITAATVGQGQGNPNPTDLGKTYVEVSKAKQHEWVYVDGKLLLQSDIVTGKPNSKNQTPVGTFVIWNKQRDTVLRGNNDDGTKYKSPVSYWMPIDYTGVGLHDSPWQPKYGGNWYTEHGSHGCINNPPEIIAKFYDVLPVGTPVVIY